MRDGELFEPGPPSASKPAVVVELPLRNGRDYPVTRAMIEKLDPCYPAVDVEQTFREMRAWLLLNTERLKTRRGIGRFIANWLSSEQAKHGKQ